MPGTHLPQAAGMTGAQPLRPGEVAVDLPAAGDAALRFIGTIRTPWARREDCPRQGDAEAGPECRIVLDPVWHPALKGLEAHDLVEVFYWMHQSRRDLVAQSPRGDGKTLGTFAIRSPIRPNPISTSVVKLLRIEDGTLVVRGLDCVDGTPLVDLKPDRSSFRPKPGPGADAAPGS
ncbi:MAG: tRNA (N6-threonylcarbamoyladenosine(37)-N6)-methyltransferase TrmO [Roseovarius sp.]|nr:tRNA (N6-threonylcarbamoyladenosine(37)-N6)-methyltransferase TrmO [Roseovarius sp.]